MVWQLSLANNFAGLKQFSWRYVAQLALHSSADVKHFSWCNMAKLSSQPSVSVVAVCIEFFQISSITTFTFQPSYLEAMDPVLNLSQFMTVTLRGDNCHTILRDSDYYIM